MEDTTPSIGLFLRSDGFAEDGKGNFAVTMQAVTLQYLDGEGRTINRLNYRVTYTSDPVAVDWPAGEKVALLPLSVVNGLLKKGYARPATLIELQKQGFQLMNEVKVEPEAPNTPSKVDDAPAGANAPEAGEDAPSGEPSEPQGAPNAPEAGEDAPSGEPSEPEGAPEPPATPPAPPAAPKAAKE